MEFLIRLKYILNYNPYYLFLSSIDVPEHLLEYAEKQNFHIQGYSFEAKEEQLRPPR